MIFFMSTNGILVILWIVGFIKVGTPAPCVYLVDPNQNDSGQTIQQCCLARNCVFNSLLDALDNVSSNVIINITSVVPLSSHVMIENADDVLITGHHNPTVSCSNSTSVRFLFSSNVAIEGITWQGCGNNNPYAPVISFFNSSEITIDRCTFDDSAGQVLSLSVMSGDVNINNCEFINNDEYNGQGVAVQYTSLGENPQLLIINNCNFISNGPAESVVYINGPTNGDGYNSLVLQNSEFIHNAGVSVLIVQTKLHLGGLVIFRHNQATNGPCIFCTNSTVLFDSISNVRFTSNVANNNGGAVYLSTGSSITFRNNMMATFEGNMAVGYGGAIFFETDVLTMAANSSVMFTGNTASTGSTLYSNGSIDVRIAGNSVIGFYANIASNTVRGDGGVMYAMENITVLIEDSSDVTFSGNIARLNGGVIYAGDTVDIIINGNSTTTCTDNMADVNGGVIYGVNYVSILINGNSDIAFSNNIATNEGGVVYIGRDGSITCNESAMIAFDGNSVGARGGTIYTDNNINIKIIGSSKATFTTNNASRGGAVYIREYGNVTFSDNSVVLFDINTGNEYGGVFYANNIDLSISGNSVATFTHNMAEHGGSTYINSHANVIFTDNSVVTFNSNTAGVNGGAFHVNVDIDIWFTGESRVMFYNNRATDGGSFYTFNFGATFNDNSVVTFVNNTVDFCGGVLYVANCSNILITGYSFVTVKDNSVGGDGGAFYIYTEFTTFGNNSETILDNNRAGSNGGCYLCKTGLHYYIHR